MERSQTICITGATGFVGKALVKGLNKAGYTNLLLPERHELDLLNWPSTENFFSNNKIDIVFFCAGKVGGIQANIDLPADFIIENLSMEINAIKSAHENGVKKFIFLGSSCMYPLAARQPYIEEDFFSGNLEPSNQSFAVAKLAGMELCRSISLQYNKPFLTAVPTGLYGPGDHLDPMYGHLVGSLIYKFKQAIDENSPTIELWGSGDQKRELLYIDDCAEALIHIMENYSDKSPINIAGGDIVSVKQVAEALREISGYNGQLVFNSNAPEGMKEKSLNPDKLNQLGWKAKTAITDGLNKTWRWAQG